MIITKNCIGCQMCNEYCPNDAIQIERDGDHYGNAFIDQDLCTDCGSCLECDCPGNALIREDN